MTDRKGAASGPGRPGLPRADPGNCPGAAGPRIRRPAFGGADARGDRAGPGRGSRPGWSSERRGRGRRGRAAARLHDRFLRRQSALVPRRRHRRAGGQRHGQRPGDDGRATPALSLAYVIEEGLPIEELRQVHRCRSPGRPFARACGSSPATPRSSTAGRPTGSSSTPPASGWWPGGVDLWADRAVAGDVLVLSGPIGLHGVAIMSVREGLDFEVEIASDTQPLNGLVAVIVASLPGGPRPARPYSRGRGIGAQRDRLRLRCGHRPSRGDDPDPRSRFTPPARCSAWTRSTSPTRASWWPWCRLPRSCRSGSDAGRSRRG